MLLEDEMSKLIDITGRRFGRWTVLERAGSARRGFTVSSLWLCRCDCGTEKIVRGDNLRNGSTQSCGCLRNERVAAAAKERLRRGADG